jgi:hypothetical protein
MVIFGFDFTPLYRRVAMAWGITPGGARVEVSHDELLVRFGPWSLRTAISNVSATEITGPYSVPKTIGPAHLSLVDRGVTFATNPRLGLCVRLHNAVPAIEPFGLIRHPAFTVTVADVDGLQAAMETRRR